MANYFYCTPLNLTYHTPFQLNIPPNQQRSHNDRNDRHLSTLSIGSSAPPGILLSAVYGGERRDQSGARWATIINAPRHSSRATTANATRTHTTSTANTTTPKTTLRKADTETRAQQLAVVKGDQITSPIRCTLYVPTWYPNAT